MMFVSVAFLLLLLSFLLFFFRAWRPNKYYILSVHTIDTVVLLYRYMYVCNDVSQYTPVVLIIFCLTPDSCTLQDYLQLWWVWLSHQRTNYYYINKIILPVIIMIDVRCLIRREFCVLLWLHLSDHRCVAPPPLVIPALSDRALLHQTFSGRVQRIDSRSYTCILCRFRFREMQVSWHRLQNNWTELTTVYTRYYYY